MHHADGRVQREGEVVHVVADRLENLTELLHSVGGRDWAAADSLDPGRRPANGPGAGTAGELAPHPGRDAGIRVPTRDFR